MKTRSDKRQVTGDMMAARRAALSCHSSLVTRHLPAFTLIELLVVISIMGLLAGLAVPALKNLGKSNVNISAQRQLLDGVAHARQLAVSQRTTVYMVFIPTNFWGNLAGLTSAQLAAVTNLVDKQLTGYTFLSYGTPGDQPGQHLWHYLGSWQSLPQGNFISGYKFLPNYKLSIPIWQSDYGRPLITAFTTAQVPFPTEQSPLAWLPCLAFNYAGQLVMPATGDEYIPLAQGSVSYGLDASKAPQLTAVTAGGITEIPPGNSTGISYNIIHIDALTGRAVLEYHKIGP